MGTILVVSGPSGSGKTTLARKLTESFCNSYFSISTTTREAREGEKDGYDYFFVTKENFLSQIQEGNFLEWAMVHNNYYGTSLKPILEALSQDKLVIFDIDVQGHRVVKEYFKNSITSVFITTDKLSTLKKRLSSRESESVNQIAKRIANAFEELEYINEYDYLLINDNLEETLDRLSVIVKSASYTTKSINLDSFLQNWKNS